MTKEWTWQAEREALLKRVKELEDALREIEADCDTACFRARAALKGEK